MNSTSIRIHLLTRRSSKVVFSVLAVCLFLMEILLLCLGDHRLRLARAAGVEEGETGPEEGTGEDEAG